MSQFILLFSAGGPGEYDDHIMVECTGRKLALQEALAAKLVTPDQLRRHRNGPCDLAWYEVTAGDEIVFTIDEWVWHNNQPSYLRRQRLTYVIPAGTLPDPPLDLDDTFFQRQDNLQEYYGEHAAQKH